MTVRHHIILNRARCMRCEDTLVSSAPEDELMCSCGYLNIQGGNEETIRRCMDLPGDEGPITNYRELSLVTSTFVRKGGLVVEAYRTEWDFSAKSFTGESAPARRGDWIVVEPEIGLTVWSPEEFHARHTEWEAE